jgi:hypothetical protein
VAKATRVDVPNDEPLYPTPQTGALSRLSSSPQPKQKLAEVEKKQKMDKLTVYLTQEQGNKIEDLAKQYRKATGEEANRIDIVRMLIDQASIDQLL